jgi:hypothetical protein
MTLDLRKARALGDFGSQMMFAPYETEAKSMLPTATLFGLSNSAMIVFGVFEDEKGVGYCLCREMPAYLSGGCWVMSNESQKGMLMMRESATLWSGGLTIESSENRIEWKSSDVFRGLSPTLRLLFDSGRVEYEERDVVKLTAHRQTTGYQFFEPTHGQGSTNHVFVATGTIAGRRVTGWLGLNTHFQRSGLNYRISPMIRGGQLLIWLDIANAFEDGSWEQGPIVVGRDGFSVAWIMNDKGQLTYSYDVSAEFDRDKDGYATEMRFSYLDARTGDPMQWVWRPKPGSNMVELPALAPHLRYKRSAEGSCVRVGERRRLRQTSAWPEFQVDDRLKAFAAEQKENIPPGFL